MEKIKKYKFFIMGGVALSTIIAVIVCYLVQNNEKDEYSVLENALVENVSLKEEKIKVHISGEVISPGVIEIEEGARIIDAIDMAGGVTEEADIRNVNLAYVLEDAMKINIPNVNDEQEEVVSGKNSDKKNNVMININTATAEDFQKLDGIGNSMALRIVSYRKENGKFNSIEDLKNISGIGDSKFERIKNNICIK